MPEMLAQKHGKNLSLWGDGGQQQQICAARQTRGVAAVFLVDFLQSAVFWSFV